MLNNLLARCPHCGKLFRGPRSSLSLQEHITNIHVAIAPISKPEIASSSPSTPSSSNDTVVAQTIDFIDHQKPYICTKCKAPFEQKDHLEKHELLHSTQGQSCQLCNKSFANVYRLQRHMLSHDESQVLRKFKCPECLKAFKFKHHLKEHIRIHSGEKPFACPNCGKRFSHSGSYSSHMTSKKCLVVNLKIRKVDQTRSQRNRNFQSSVNNGINNCLTSQSSIAKSDIFSNNCVTQTNSRSSIKNHFVNKKEESVPVLKSELNFPLFLSPELQQCSHENSSLQNYFPPNSYPSSLNNLHPALYSVAAASVGLPSPYFANYSDMTNTILRSQVNIKSINDTEISKENIKETEKSEHKTKLENYDLNSMRKILQIVDATVAANTHQESSVNVVNGSYGDNNRSSNPSPLELSASSLHLPQIAPIDSPDDINKSVSSCVTSFKCKYCSNYFDNKIDLHQHVSFVCYKNKQNLSENKCSADVTKDYLADLKPQFQSNNLNSSAAESDEESQRDSSLDDEVMMTDGKKVRVRSVLGEETLRILRAQYEINPRPKKHDILRLSEEVNYSPRVVQVWFQNMRARDRRLGRPIPSNNLCSELNLENCNTSNANAINTIGAHLVTTTLPHTPHSATHVTLAEAHQLTPQSHSIGSIGTPLMPISIPHYKPALNLSHSGIHSFPSITPFQPEFNGISMFGRKQRNAVYYMNSSEFSYSTSDSHKLFGNQSVLEEPLDLSVRNKSYLEDKTNNNIEGNIDSAEDKLISAEALNLSQKSSKTQLNENSSDEILSGNISLAILKQQQRQCKDNEQQNSIVRSMLMNKCGSGSDGSASPVNRFNILTVNGSMQSPKEAANVNRCSPTVPTILQQNCDKRESVSVKHCHSDSEYNEHHSDSNNPSDDYICANSPQTPTKLVIASPSKLFKGNGENVISREDQSSPTDASIQLDGPGLYTCDQCDKTFSKQSSLARHKYEHSGQRPHKCDVCNKAFKHKHHLTEHKRLHSGEKPFQCKKCLKRFSHSGSYSQHMNHRYSYCKPYRE